MRTARGVYKKIRDIKFRYLVRLYKKFTRKAPENCVYNYPYKVDGSSVLRICLLHQPNLDLNSGIFPHLIEICHDPKHCTNCNGFILKHTKESIKKSFEEDLVNRKELYPEINALVWVLDQEKEQKSMFHKFFNILRGHS